jgi:hypothetical protein
MPSYGTVMIGKLAEGMTLSEWKNELEEWKRARNVPGFQNAYALVTDDGETIVTCAVFESKESYFKLADDPEQDKWYQEKIAPRLNGEPTWIDGTWSD